MLLSSEEKEHETVLTYPRTCKYASTNIQMADLFLISVMMMVFNFCKMKLINTSNCVPNESGLHVSFIKSDSNTFVTFYMKMTAVSAEFGHSGRMPRVSGCNL